MQLPRLPTLTSLASALAFSTCVAALQPPPLPVHTVVDFGLGFWIENIRVRATGEILAVGPFSPTLYQVDPSLATPTKVAVHTFPVGGLVGITETTPDVFYVVTGNFSNTLTPVPGSYAVWQVNMLGFSTTKKPALVTRVTSFPSAQELNGMTTVNSQLGLVEISDPALGLVWSLNVHTGAQSQVINLPNMKSIVGSTPTLGVNGIHYTNNTLYYTSTDQQLFVSLPISPLRGAATGGPRVIAGGFGRLDDFDLDDVANAYIAVNSTVLSFVQPNGQVRTLAGGGSSTAVSGITGAKFGRTSSDRKVLYMGTTGGSYQYVTGNFTSPGAILKMDLGAAGYFDSV